MGELIREVQKNQSSASAQVAELSRKLGVAQTATRAFLFILNQKDVAEDDLTTKLLEIAHTYKSMEQRLAALSTSDADIQPLLDQARSEAGAGHYLAAERLLGQAEQLSLQSLETARRKLLERGRDAATTRASIADLQLVQLNYSGAFSSLKEAARLTTEYAPELEIDYQFRFGTIAAEMEHWAEASLAFERALRLAEIRPGYGRETLTRLKTWLAMAKGRTNAEPEGEALFQEALDSFLAANDFANAARTLNSMSRVVEIQNRKPEAVKLIQRAVLLGSRALGRRHADVAVWTNSLGCCRLDQGRFAAARRLFSAAVKIDEQTLGLDHPQALRHVANLGTTLFAMGKYDEGAPFLEKSIKGGTRSFGSSSNIVLRRLANFVIYLLDTKKYDQAERLLREALEGEASAAERAREAMILLRNAFGRLLTETGRAKEALPHLAKALSEATAKFGPTDPATIIIAGNLARALGENRQDDEAFKKFNDLVQLIEANDLSTHPRVHRVYRYFSDFCRRCGLDERATQLDALGERAVSLHQ